MPASHQTGPAVEPGQRGHEPVLIVGTGAMACLFAARLAKANVPVTLLGTWPAGLEALRTRGVRLVRADGGEDAFAVATATSAGDCVGHRYALVLVKSWQTERAARQLATCLEPDGMALTLQNGLGNRQSLEQTLGKERVALGVTTSGATLLGPGRVRPGGEGMVSIGEHAHVGPLAGLLQRAGFAAEIVRSSEDLLWSKLVINAAINPLTALLRVANGELLDRPAARTLMAEIAREAAEVAAACGHNLAYSDPVAAVERVAQRTASNRSSMLQDILRGAPTEIDAINGAIVTLGEGCGVDVATNRALWLLVRALGEEA